MAALANLVLMILLAILLPALQLLASSAAPSAATAAAPPAAPPAALAQPAVLARAFSLEPTARCPPAPAVPSSWCAKDTGPRYVFVVADECSTTHRVELRTTSF